MIQLPEIHISRCNDSKGLQNWELTLGGCEQLSSLADCLESLLQPFASRIHRRQEQARILLLCSADRKPLDKLQLGCLTREALLTFLHSQEHETP